jgi:hypothetical protein
MRYLFPLLFVFPVVAAAQAPTGPTIDLSAAGSNSTDSTSTDGTASVSGRINLTPGWQLSIHTLTIRYVKDGAARTLNVLVPVKGETFSVELALKKGSYQIWGVIDVKDSAGREKQISSGKQDVSVK